MTTESQPVLSLDQQMAILTRGCTDVVRPSDLRAKLQRSLETGVPLTVKVGFDPTAPDLHLGHTVLLRKMKHFQDLGHRVIFLIGAFTGLIGDPSGRSKTRPPLTADDIAANAETYKAQVFKILDPGRTIIDFNDRWLGAMTSVDWVKLAARYNVAQMLERRDFRQRFEQGQPIAMHEFLYPLAQAYDSVHLQADVELGGTDQLFNLNVGRDLMPSYGLEPQVVMTVPLLVGLDGVEKMSKSLGNYVGVSEPAEVILRKIVEDFRGSDEVMWTYFTLLTDLAPEAIGALQARFAAGEVSASDLRYTLGRRIATDFHDEAAAAAAEQQVRARHAARRGGQAAADEVPVVDVPAGQLLRKALVDVGFATSSTDATRKIAQGGVRVDGAVVSDINAACPDAVALLQVGKRQIVRIRPV
jgi:tyrosyl-tRNA synthetase